MDPLRVAVLVGLLVPAGCRGGPEPAPPRPRSPSVAPAAPGSAFASVAEAVMAAQLEAWPVFATEVGEHRHDHRWPDLSAPALEDRRARVGRDLAALERVCGASLPLEARVDCEILSDALALERFEFEVERPWARDPSWGVAQIGDGLHELVARDFAPLEERARAMVERLASLPAFVEALEGALEPTLALQPHATVAYGQMRGLHLLLQETIPAAFADLPPPAADRVERALEPARAALQDLQRFLGDEVLPRANGDPRLGPEAFARKLALTLQTGIGAEELRARASIEHDRVRRAMTERATRLAPTLLGAAAAEQLVAQAESDGGDALTRHVLRALGEWAVEPERLRDAVEATLARLHDFVRAEAIVPLDPAERLEVIWTPPHQRGVFIAGLAPPGPLDTAAAELPSFYLVQPVPEHWDAETRSSFLREYNRFMLEVLSIHEAIPGHFVQLYHGKRIDSPIRRVYANGPFVEGWAVYAEWLMVEHGYAGAAPTGPRPPTLAPGLWQVLQDPVLRADAIALHRLKFYLRSVTNALLDYGVHAGGMRREEALELMMRGAFQERGEAEAKWTRASMTSTQLSTYFAGMQGWLALRARAQRELGPSRWSEASFHAAALGHGAPPLPLLAGLLEADGWLTSSEAGSDEPGSDRRETTRTPP